MRHSQLSCSAVLLPKLLESSCQFPSPTPPGPRSVPRHQHLHTHTHFSHCDNSCYTAGRASNTLAILWTILIKCKYLWIVPTILLVNFPTPKAGNAVFGNHKGCHDYHCRQALCPTQRYTDLHTYRHYSTETSIHTGITPLKPPYIQALPR